MLSRKLTNLARQAVARASAHLADTTADNAPRIHETRKALKEARAILRLGRYALDGDFRALNTAFRDAGRSLAAARDVDALVAMAKSLRKSTHDPLERRALTRVRRILSADLPTPDVSAPALPEVTFTAHGVEWLERGLRRSYRDGRLAFREALAARDAPALHEWRKRVKDLWYQLQIVAPRDARVDALRALSRLLGDHPDVWALHQCVAADRRRFGKLTAARVAAVTTRRLEELEIAALQSGESLYAGRPRVWAEGIVDDMIAAAWD